jgi:hypothetical protein
VDFLLLRQDPDEQFRVAAGVVCFPSNWNFRESLGRTVFAVHEVVPGLNEPLGRKIHSLLANLAPGEAWARSNWGLSRSAEMNQHPARRLASLDYGPCERIWIRIEQQLFFRLPRTAGILFGIRPVTFALKDFCRDRDTTRILKRFLSTMPPELREYKGFAASWTEALRQIETIENELRDS